MDQAITRFIHHMRQFGHIPENKVSLIADHCCLDLVPAGSFYILEGKVSHRNGFIAEGVMRYCNTDTDGNLITCYFVAENDLAGEPKLPQIAPSRLILQAVTDTLVVSIAREQEQALLAQFPELGPTLSLMVQSFMGGLINQRAFLLNQDAKSKYQYFLEHYPHILSRVPLSMVASYLGITQPSLSRLRKG